MKRNKLGQYRSQLKASRLVLAGVVLIGTLFLATKSADAANSGKQVIIQQGESVTVSCTSPVATNSPTPTPDTLSVVERHVTQYGGKFSHANLVYALSRCGSLEKVKTLIAISVAESSMGKNSQRGMNYWSWGKGTFKTMEEGINTMCQALNGGAYTNLVIDGQVNRTLARCYVNGCKSSTYPEKWISQVQWSLNQMEK